MQRIAQSRATRAAAKASYEQNLAEQLATFRERQQQRAAQAGGAGATRNYAQRSSYRGASSSSSRTYSSSKKASRKQVYLGNQETLATERVFGTVR